MFEILAGTYSICWVSVSLVVHVMTGGGMYGMRADRSIVLGARKGCVGRLASRSRKNPRWGGYDDGSCAGSVRE
jgi:hypothetical protein